MGSSTSLFLRADSPQSTYAQDPDDEDFKFGAGSDSSESESEMSEDEATEPEHKRARISLGGTSSSRAAGENSAVRAMGEQQDVHSTGKRPYDQISQDDVTAWLQESPSVDRSAEQPVRGVGARGRNQSR